jgi:hypothetical protein
MSHREYLVKVDNFLGEIPCRENENVHEMRMALWEIQENLYTWLKGSDAELRVNLKDWADKHFYLRKA